MGTSLGADGEGAEAGHFPVFCPWEESMTCSLLHSGVLP